MTRLLKAISWLFSHPLHFLLFSLVLLFSFCSKPAGRVGAVIQPEQSKLEVFWSDTTTVVAYSVPEDSIRTDEISKNLLGSIADPVFGKSVAGIYTQFKLSLSAPDFGVNPVLDSLVLHLLYQGDPYGDTSTPLVVHAYEMLEGIDYFGEYYSNTIIPVDPFDYANHTYLPRPYDSIVVEDDTLPAALRIRLSDNSSALGDKFLNADTAYLSNSDAFVEFFKGLYVVTSPVNEGGSISYFNLLSTQSEMVMYYHNDSVDSLNFRFVITEFTPRFNRYEHDFFNAGSEFKAQVIEGDKSLGMKKFYIQGISGVRGILYFPFIREWANLGNIAINEAKLVLPGYEANPYRGAPDQLALVEIQEDGTYFPLIDEQEGTNFFDGRYKSSTNSFTFRITRHIQSLISDTLKPNNGLYLFVRGESVKPERFIFNGHQPEADTVAPLRLEIIYTKLK